MRKLFLCLFCLGGLSNCSQQQSVVKGRRVSLAKGNISFVLPDDSLTHSKPLLWGADYNGGEYGEAGAFYHNRDSTVRISVYVTAYPNAFQGKAPWGIIADKKESCQVLLAKNHNLASIEDFNADSLTRTVAISYRSLNKQEHGWRGQSSYDKSIVIHGRHRVISFWLSGPDNAVTRQQFAAIQASILVAPAYLQDTVAAHQTQAMRD